jgi:hypothetical protein
MNQPIQEYLRNKEAREQMPYTYLGWMGTGFYSDKDNVLSHEDLAKTYPLGEKVTLWNHNDKGSNPDKKRVI